CPPPLLRDLIDETRALTAKPFGVNVILDPALILRVDRADVIQTCIDARVPVLSLSFGDPTPYVAAAHAARIAVLHQAGSVADAQRAAGAGVDAVIAQGVEAGGHLSGPVTTLALVPRVVDAIAPTPVIAAGGIADARGLVAALALGADGVVVGTRFLATPEAAAHPRYKAKLVAATEADTIRTRLFAGGWPGTPHRVLRTPFVNQWQDDARGSASDPDEPVVAATRLDGQTVPVRRFDALPPDVTTDGDLEAMCFMAGEGVGLIDAVTPAAEVVRAFVEGARRIIDERFAPSAIAGPPRTA
ncbi:MAG TPA: nitronate monooxygenase family protein, partial [Thermomicrobiales bacterium]|nr:nitronate monooxygenase family protein [Thermomicrobiales bacterium]